MILWYGMMISYSYLRYTDRLFDVFLLFFTVILLELHKKQRREDWVAEKKYIDEPLWGTSLFSCTPSFLHYFLSNPSLLSPPILCRKIAILLQKLLKKHPLSPQCLWHWHINRSKWNEMNLLCILTTSKLN